jgi:tRNA-splicing ligase RtcB
MKGVVFSGWGKDRKGRIDLGEAPQAYKDIDMVMASQQDLVESVVKLEPVGAVKG